MPEQIVLYDVPTRFPRKCWSPNAWKIRLLLNYKNIEYKTEWLEYPEIQSQLEKHVAPNQSGIAYTIPTIQLQSGEWIMESSEIARRLEQLYPNPAIEASVLDVEINALTEKVMGIISPDFIPKIPRTLIAAASVPYWRKTREAWYDGVSLDMIEASHGGGQVYEAARPYVRQLASLLESSTNGPFFGGRRPIYGDFVWSGVLYFYEKLGNDMFASLTFPDQETHMRLLVACRPWFERDDR